MDEIEAAKKIQADRQKAKELREQTEAAKKIQAIQRGKAERQKVKELKEQTEAAKKIQAIQRGKADRQKVKELKEQSEIESKSTEVNKETVLDKEPGKSVEDGAKEPQDQVKGGNAAIDIKEGGASEVNETSVDEADPNDA